MQVYYYYQCMQGTIYWYWYWCAWYYSTLQDSVTCMQVYTMSNLRYDAMHQHQVLQSSLHLHLHLTLSPKLKIKLKLLRVLAYQHTCLSFSSSFVFSMHITNKYILYIIQYYIHTPCVNLYLVPHWGTVELALSNKVTNTDTGYRGSVWYRIP